ncbi:MAG: DNA repair and recombination protein RadA [Candidatus Heimdallarchaeota archaeon LC_2]|nr:MAG: DNA repair and recombination protein RadA [Candidatus Heimdallarchaeota archaeon LC_2]
MTAQKIEGLESLDQDTIEALIEAGYNSIQSIAIALSSDLVIDIGVSEVIAEEIIGKAISSVTNPPLTAADLLKMEQARGKVTTSSNSLDGLLKGGPWVAEITEISGGFATGKSQLCFQLSVNAQLDLSYGGLGGKVFFVDTEGTFSATRVGEMALAKDLDPHEILSNIYVVRVLDSKHQTQIVQQINDLAKKENIRLVVIDSIAAHFRTDYIGPNKIAERQQKIMQHASSLTKLAYVHDLAVVVTNQIVAKLDKISGGSEIQPALGEAWSHRPQTRIILRKSTGEARIARLSDSPRHPEAEVVFYITDKGIRDKPKS